MTDQERQQAFIQNLKQVTDQLARTFGYEIKAVIQTRQLNDGMCQSEAVLAAVPVQGWQPPADDQKSETAITKTDG